MPNTPKRKNTRKAKPETKKASTLEVAGKDQLSMDKGVRKDVIALGENDKAKWKHLAAIVRFIIAFAKRNGQSLDTSLKIFNNVLAAVYPHKRKDGTWTTADGQENANKVNAIRQLVRRTVYGYLTTKRVSGSVDQGTAQYVHDMLNMPAPTAELRKQVGFVAPKAPSKRQKRAALLKAWVEKPVDAVVKLADDITLLVDVFTTGGVSLPGTLEVKKAQAAYERIVRSIGVLAKRKDAADKGAQKSA